MGVRLLQQKVLRGGESMKTFRVMGTCTTEWYTTVKATSREEAVQKANDGQHEDIEEDLKSANIEFHDADEVKE